MISKYSDFIFESSIESISESIVYLSPNLRKVLKKMDNDIAKDILGVEGKDIKDDVTFIDVDKQDGYFSFATMKNAIKYIKSDFGGDDSTYLSIENSPRVALSDSFYTFYDDKSMWKTGRNPLRIGRMINKLLPGKYSDKEREQFTNKFKATLDKVGERFILVSGQDIPKWYSDNNYFSMAHTLGSSCMRSKSDDIFQIYSENPEVCQMLCIVEENDNGVPLLKARALVWKVSDFGWWSGDPSKELPKFEYFMDRQYAISDALIEKMKIYAKDQGWAFKTFNNHHSYQNVTISDQNLMLLMKVALKKENYKRYPYMDTFRRYSPDSSTLFSDDSEDVAGDFILEDTNGGCREVGDNDGGYYSEYYDRELSEDEAVWSEHYQDYLPREQAIYISHGSGRLLGWYAEDDDDIVYDEWTSIYIHFDDAVYCEEYGNFIFNEDAVSVVMRIDDNGNCNSDDYYLHNRDARVVQFDDLRELVWYTNIIKKADYWDVHSGILASLLTKDWSNYWIPIKFKINTYKVTDETHMDYITDIDAEILDVVIDKSNSRIEDAWTYTERLKDSNLIPQLKFAIKSKIKQDQLSFEFGDEFDKPVKDRLESYKKRLEQLDIFIVE